MPDLSNNMQYFALVLSRVLGLFFIAPILSSQSITYRFRFILALLVSFLLYSSVVNYLPKLSSTPQEFALDIFAQFMIGAVIAFLILIVFSAFQIIGEVFSIQMGLSFSEVLDPQSQVSLPLLGILKNSIGILIFLSVPFQMDGQYMPALMHMLRALSYSFVQVPTLFLSQQIQGGILQYIDQSFGTMFITALKVGVPMIGILFISSLTLGILGKAAPQMNLISMGIQINIGVGLLLFLFLIPVVIPIMLDSFTVLYDQIGEMLQTWPK